nr:DbpA RNA binding domain-containing protein [Salinisphaera halophila]
MAQLLSARGFDALALHGERDQRDRDEVLLRFINHSCAVLVATDVAARGLDIAALPQVISYDIARDVDTHVHRIGRTGRAGASGTAATLCTPGEAYRAERLAEELKTPLSWQSPPKLEPVTPLTAPNRTLIIGGGRKDKLRPGDILGALTGEAGLDADAIGQISIQPTRSYVAIARGQAPSALVRIRDGRIKGRRFRVQELRGG